MAIDLAEKIGEGEGFDHLHLVRVEQLYPFPEKEIADVFAKFPNAKTIKWAQEEPKNMGSWFLADPYLRELATDAQEVKYIGRPALSSPAEGDADAYKEAQAIVIEDSLSK